MTKEQMNQALKELVEMGLVTAKPNENGELVYTAVVPACSDKVAEEKFLESVEEKLK